MGCLRLQLPSPDISKEDLLTLLLVRMQQVLVQPRGHSCIQRWRLCMSQPLLKEHMQVSWAAGSFVCRSRRLQWLCQALDRAAGIQLAVGNQQRPGGDGWQRVGCIIGLQSRGTISLGHA